MALAGPLAGSALAAPKKQPAPVPALSLSVPSGAKLLTPSNRTNSHFVTVNWTPSTSPTESYTCFFDTAKVTCGSGTATSASLADGNHTFTLKAKATGGTSGNYRPGSGSIPFTVDTTAPAPQPTVVSSVSSPTKNSSVTVSWTDTSTDVLAGYTCELVRDNVVVDGPSDCTNSTSVPAPASGAKLYPNLTDNGADGPAQYTALVWAVDDLGNPTPLSLATPGSVTWSVDSHAPGSPTFDPASLPANPTNVASANIKWTDADFDGGSVTSYTCKLDGAAYTPCSASGTPVTVGDGSHTFVVQGVDAANNVGLPAQYSWTVLTAKPAMPVITSGPTDPTDQTDATFAFGDSTPGVSYLCAVDPAAASDYLPCTSPATRSVPGNGTYHFDVMAKDVAGNLSDPREYTWSVDTTAASIVLSEPVFQSGPNAFSNDTDPAFTWLDVDPATNHDECKLDNGSWQTCASGDQFAVSGPDAPHTLFLESVDSSGNDSPIVHWTWTLDRTAPTAPVFSTKPALVSNSSDAVFSFASDLGTALSCVLDSGDKTLCASPASFSDLADGHHVFTAFAKDAAGNESSTTYEWDIDTSAPPAPVLTGPDALTNNNAPSISWTDSDAVALASSTCQLNGADVPGCDPAGTDLGPLSDGDYTFVVTVTKNSHTAQDEVTWTQDTTAPDLTINGLPSEGSYSPATGYSVSVTQPTEAHPSDISCSLTGPVTSTDCSSLAGLTDGTYTFTADSTDLAGNPAEVTRSWTVDATNPSVSAPGLPEEGSVVDMADLAPQLDASDTNLDKVTCTLTDGTTTVSTCDADYPVSDASYTYSVAAVDLAGNETDLVRHFVVDTTAPELSLDPVSDNTANLDPTTVIHITDANPNPPTCSWTKDGNEFDTTCAAQTNLGDGHFTLTVDETDQAGHPAQEQSVSWINNHVPPALTVTGVPTGLTNVDHFSPVITTDGATQTCSLAGPTPTAEGACVATYSGLADGDYTFTVKSTDAQNNTSTDVKSFTLDTTAPKAAIATPGTLTGAAVVTWSEPVSALDVTKVALKETDSGKLVPATVMLTTSSMTVTPKIRLVAGQHYTVSVAAGAVQDAASNGSLVAARSFRAQRTLQENTLPESTTWRTVKVQTAYGHSYVTEHLAGAQSSWAFRGTSITWWTMRGPTEGKAAVYVDGHRKAVVNNYAPETSYRIARTFKRLGAGRHVLTIRVLGVKGARSGTGTSIGIDAFTVAKKRTSSPRLSTSWHRLSGTAYYGRHAVVANLKGEAISLTFRGTSIAWTTVRNRTQGKAAVYIDGVRKAIVDNYSTKSLTKVRRLVKGLTDSVHTVRIVVLGTHHKGGKGNNVTVDRFVIG